MASVKYGVCGIEVLAVIMDNKLRSDEPGIHGDPAEECGIATTNIDVMTLKRRLWRKKQSIARKATTLDDIYMY